MSIKSLPTGRPFKPGQSGNPGGKPKLPEHIKLFRKTSYEDFVNHLQRFGSCSQLEFQSELDRHNATVLERMFSKLLLQAVEGDRHARSEVFDRLWGKVKETCEVQSQSLEEKIKGLTPEKQEQLTSLLNEISLMP